MILLLSMVMGMSPASAAITEVDLQVIPQKQPRWMMGDGSLALSALSTGYTSWGSVSASVDLQFAADFETTPSLFLVSATPVYSLQRLLNRPIPILGISDYGVFAQVKVIAHERPYGTWIEACNFRRPGQNAFSIGRKLCG